MIGTQKLKKIIQKIKRFPEKALQRIIDLQLITFMLKSLIGLLASSCILALILIYQFQSDYDMYWWIAVPALTVIFLVPLRSFAVKYVKKRQFEKIQEIYKTGNDYKSQDEYKKPVAIYNQRKEGVKQNKRQLDNMYGGNKGMSQERDNDYKSGQHDQKLKGKQYQNPFSRSFFVDRNNSKSMRINQGKYKNRSCLQPNAQSSFNWGQVLKRSLYDTNKQNSLIRNFLDYTNKDDNQNNNKNSLKEVGKPISNIFNYYNDNQSIPNGASRIHSSTKISSENVIRFVPREYLQSEQNPILLKLIDQHQRTLKRYGFENKNMDDRYQFVKKSIYKLLQKHNQQQAGSLLMFAQALQAFFQIKIVYKNPYINHQQFNLATGMLIQYSFPFVAGQEFNKDKNKRKANQNKSDQTLNKVSDYLDYKSGKFRIMKYSSDFTVIQQTLNEIVKSCAQNPRKKYKSQVNQCYQQIQLHEAIQKVMVYASKRRVQSPPFRYRYQQFKEETFIAISNLVRMRKDLDLYLIDIHQKSIKGIQRIKALEKSAAIQRNLSESFLQRKFPSKLYRERRQAYELIVDKNSQKRFLLNFFCLIMKKILMESKRLCPVVKSPSFFNFSYNEFTFYRQVGQETGQSHYNFLFKSDGKDETISCCPGKDNFYSAVFFYFLVLQEKQQKLLKQKKQLKTLIQQMLPLQGI